jgi:hypothetical protein
VYQVSCIIELEPFYRLFNPSVVEESSINPYYLAFSAIISGVAREQGKLGLHDEVDFIFDDQVMEKDKIVRAWDAFKTNASTDTRGLIGSVPYFRDDKKFLPIQAADLIAWWVRKLVTEKRGGDEPAVLPWKATRQIPGFQFYYDEDRLKLALENTMRSANPSSEAAQSS